MTNKKNIIKGSTQVNAKVNISLANGSSEEIDYSLPYAFKSGTDARVVSRVCTLAMQMYKEYEAISTGYFKLVPLISDVIAEESWKELEGCGGINQFIQSVTGCSKSSASEMVKVAKAFYTSGKIIDGFELFSYTELVKLAGCEPEVREAVRDRIASLGGAKHTRKEMLEILKDEQAKALEAKNEEQFGKEIAEPEEKPEENSAIELEQEPEPIPNEAIDEKSEWENVGDTLHGVEGFLRLIGKSLSSSALDAKASKDVLKTGMLQVAEAIKQLLINQLSLEDAACDNELCRMIFAQLKEEEEVDA